MMPVRLPLLERIEPTIGADEEEYRRHFFATDTKQATVSAFMVLVLVAIVLAVNAAAWGTRVWSERQAG